MNNNDRTYVITFLIGFVAIIFIGRLFFVQVVQEKWKMRAVQITERAITQYPSRGIIYDRNNNVLVANTAVYDLMVVPNKVKQFDTTEFCRLVDIPEKAELEGLLKKAKRYSPFKPSVLIAQIPAREFSDISENLDRFEGFYGVPKTMRKYPDGIGSHLVGYVNEVGPKEIEKDNYYKSGDYIGINGIERAYEKPLRGKKGVTYMLVDVHNNEKGRYAEGRYDTASVSGMSLVSTIDIELQKYGELLMQNKRGSVVAIEPATGEILSMVNNPSYDPNLLVGRYMSRNYHKLQTDTLKPLFNRALQAKYPPGSTFKLLNALIGLEENAITPNTYFSCYGGYRFGRRKLGCHAHSSPVNLNYSITTSCNAYYCHTFKDVIDAASNAEVGYQKWRDRVVQFGLGDRLGIDLGGEVRGLVPQTSYYDRYYGQGSWKPHTIISLAIGQGELGVTPIQMANYTAALANRGFYYTPHAVKQIGDSIIPLEAFGYHKIDIKKENFELVIDAMENVIERGTGRGVKYDETAICGKTGTAQNPHGKDHSIFIAFAPKENPKIAVAVYVENVGFGSTWAAPITSLMIEKYLTGEISRPHVEERMTSANLLAN